MLRVLEVAGLVGPVLGGVVLFVYRDRFRPALMWGTIACVLALASLLLGVFGDRVSIAGVLVSGRGIDEAWASASLVFLVRLVLLLVASGVLVIAALVGRDGRSPVGWIAAGVVTMAAGVGLHFIEVDFGGEHRGLAAMAEMMVEVVEIGLVGIGFLVLCVAVVAKRPVGDSGRADPAELARDLAARAWRAYTDGRRGLRG